VRDDGVPIRTRAGWHNAHGVTTGAVADTRVTHRTATIQGKPTGQGEVATKYTEEGSDIRLVNWKEMVLIRAEIAGGQAAIDLVNTLRTADNLPRVTYANPSDAKQIKYMIFEERSAHSSTRAASFTPSSRTSTSSGSRGITAPPGDSAAD
jgi:hypothetical protein